MQLVFVDRESRAGLYLTDCGQWRGDRRVWPDRRAAKKPTSAQLALRRKVRREVDREIICFLDLAS